MKLYCSDQAVIHPNGYGEIVGRIKDMVIRGGENIYPREIEEVLHQHPGVLEASVIGVPDPRMGEELCAWIRASDAALDTAAVREFCKGKVRISVSGRHIMGLNSFILYTDRAFQDSEEHPLCGGLSHDHNGQDSEVQDARRRTEVAGWRTIS